MCSPGLEMVFPNLVLPLTHWKPCSALPLPHLPSTGARRREELEAEKVKIMG